MSDVTFDHVVQFTLVLGALVFLLGLVETVIRFRPSWTRFLVRLFMRL